MLLDHLPPFEALLVLIMVIGQIAVSLIFLRAELHSSYPRFTTNVCFYAAQGIVLNLVPIRWYVAAWLASSLVGCFLLAFAVLELYEHVLGPWESLPDWVPRHVVGLLSAAVCSSAALGLCFEATLGGPLIRLLETSDAATVALASLALWHLIIYSRWLGSTWMDWPSRIAFGFVLWTSVNTVCLFLASRQTTPARALIYLEVGQIVYIASLTWWSVVLWEKEPVPEKATAEMLRNIVEPLREDERILESLRRVS